MEAYFMKKGRKHGEEEKVAEQLWKKEFSTFGFSFLMKEK